MMATLLQKTRQKRAIEQQETPFEAAFANLAYQVIRDKAPRILDFIVGFQLVDRNEDNTKAVGIFGAKSADRWFYIPMFFVNNDLKGRELLWIKDSDQFVPLRENWVNYLLSRKNSLLGEPIKQNAQQVGVGVPDLTALSVYPTIYGNKYASANKIIPALPADMWPAMKQFAKYATTNPLRDPKFDGLFNLQSFLQTSLPLTKIAFAWSERYPVIKKAIHQFYGPKFFTKLAEGFMKQAKEADFDRQWKAAQPKPDSPAVYEEVSIAYYDEQGGQKQPKMELTTAHNVDTESLPKETKLIENHPEGTRYDTPYREQGILSLSNPTETCLARVLVKPQDFEDCLIIKAPISDRGTQGFSLVITLEDKTTDMGHGKSRKGRLASNAEEGAIWARFDTPMDEMRQWISELPEAKNLEEDNHYVLLHPECRTGTCIFKVTRDLGDGKYQVHWDDCVDQRIPSYSEYNSIRGSNYRVSLMGDSAPYDYNSNPVLCLGTKGSEIYALNGEVYVPEGSRMLLVQKAEPKPSFNAAGSVDYDKVPYWWNNGPEKLRLQDLYGADMSLFYKSAGEKVSAWKTVSGMFRIQDLSGIQEFTSLDKTAQYLREKHRLSLGVAEKIASEMTVLTRDYRIVKPEKKAAPGPGVGGSLLLDEGAYGMPFPPEQIMSSDPYMGANAPTTTEQIDFQRVPGMPMYQDGADYMDPPAPDQQAVQTAQQASDGGMKELFDTTMMTSLAKTMREDSMIDKYIGPGMKWLDSLGRMLFFFYWHPEIFENRFGQQDMPELEDAFRNNFEQTGDLVLFLKQKTMDAPGSVGGEQGEPTLGGSLFK